MLPLVLGSIPKGLQTALFTMCSRCLSSPLVCTWVSLLFLQCASWLAITHGMHMSSLWLYAVINYVDENQSPYCCWRRSSCSCFWLAMRWLLFMQMVVIWIMVTESVTLFVLKRRWPTNNYWLYWLMTYNSLCFNIVGWTEMFIQISVAAVVRPFYPLQPRTSTITCSELS